MDVDSDTQLALLQGVPLSEGKSRSAQTRNRYEMRKINAFDFVAWDSTNQQDWKDLRQ